MEKELGKTLNFEEVKTVLKGHLAEEFNIKYI
jgi:hypothetical protein